MTHFIKPKYSFTNIENMKNIVLFQCYPCINAYNMFIDPFFRKEEK